MFLRYISEKLARRAAPSKLIKPSELMKLVDCESKENFTNKPSLDPIAFKRLSGTSKAMDYDCLPNVMMHHVGDKEPTQNSETVGIPVKSISNVECGAMDRGLDLSSVAQTPVRIDIVQNSKAIPYRYKFNINKLGSTPTEKGRSVTMSDDIDDKPKRIKPEDDDFMTSTTESVREADGVPLTPRGKQMGTVKRKTIHRSNESNLNQTVLNSIRSFNSANRTLVGKPSGSAIAGNILDAHPRGPANQTAWKPVPHFSSRNRLEGIHRISDLNKAGGRYSDDNSFAADQSNNDDDSLYEYPDESFRDSDGNLSNAAISNMNFYQGTLYRGYEKYSHSRRNQSYSRYFGDPDFPYFNDYYPSYTDYTTVPYSDLDETPSSRIEDMKAFKSSNVYHSDGSNSIYSYDTKILGDNGWASDTDSDMIQPLKVWSYPNEFKSSFNITSDDKRKSNVTVNKIVR